MIEPPSQKEEEREKILGGIKEDPRREPGWMAYLPASLPAKTG